MDINQRLITMASDTVLDVSYELNEDDNIIYDLIKIPENIEVFISDLTSKKVVCHSNLRVLDLHPMVNTDLDFNIVSSLQFLIIRHTNIVNKTVLELFPKNCKYRYTECSLNNVPLSKLVNEYYKNYFGKYPSYQTIYGKFLKIQNNIINYRIHSTIIEEIHQYESNIKRAKDLMSRIKEEIIQKAMHPDRIKYLLITKGYSIDEVVNMFL